MLKQSMSCWSTSLSQPILREKLISTNSQVRMKVVFIGYITRFIHDNNLKSLEQSFFKFLFDEATTLLFHLFIR